jgi:hypothetical protein
MAAVLDPKPENVNKVHSLKAKKMHKRRKNLKFCNPMKKKQGKPMTKRPKTDQAFNTSAMK